MPAPLPVVAYGECLIDFLGGRTEAGGLAPFTPYPGGAPANVAVAVARLGGTAHFMGQVGADMFGDFLAAELARYGVNTGSLARHATAPTALACVSLDPSGERSFSFRRSGTADLALTPDLLNRLWPDGAAFFHHCSNMLTAAAIADLSEHAAARARQSGALVSFDANLRPALWPEAAPDRARVTRSAKAADIVKLAREELDYLSEGRLGDYLAGLLDAGVRLVFITDGAAPVRAISARLDITLPVPSVRPVDTTGAGDAFSSGYLYALSRLGGAAFLDLVTQDRDTLAALTRFASACGAHAVTLPGAFPAMPAFDDVADAWTFTA